MSNKIAWGGAILVAVGLVLPWASFSFSMAGISQSGSAAGYEYIQSIVALALSAIGILVSLKLSDTARALVLLASGAIVVIVAATAFGDLSGPAQTISPPSLQLPSDWPSDMPRPGGLPEGRASARPQVGLFVTLLGGAIIAIAGLIQLVRRDK